MSTWHPDRWSHVRLDLWPSDSYLSSLSRQCTRMGRIPDLIRSSMGGLRSLDSSFLRNGVGIKNTVHIAQLKHNTRAGKYKRILTAQPAQRSAECPGYHWWHSTNTHNNTHIIIISSYWPQNILSNLIHTYLHYCFQRCVLLSWRKENTHQDYWTTELSNNDDERNLLIWNLHQHQNHHRRPRVARSFSSGGVHLSCSTTHNASVQTSSHYFPRMCELMKSLSF